MEHRLQKLINVQQEAARILTESASIDTAAPAVLELLCLRLGWDVGVFWSYDPAAGRLLCRSSWGTKEYETFRAELQNWSFKRGEGIPGQVWETGSAHSIADFQTQDGFLRMLPARNAGLRSTFGVPIDVRNHHLGLLELFAQSSAEPDETLVLVMTSIGKQFGQFVERIHAEEALRASDALKSSILTSALDSIIAFDHLGRIIEWNSAAEVTFGYTRKEALDSSFIDLIVPEEHRREYQGLIRNYLSRRGDSTIIGRMVEREVKRKDGSRFPAEVTIAPTNTLDRIMFTAYIRDISERKRAEHAIRKAERDLRSIIESVEDYAIFTVDLEGTIQSWNVGAERLFGYSEEEALGQPGAILFKTEDREAGVPEQEIHSALETGRAMDERWHLRRDGSLFFASGVMTPIVADGVVTGFTKIARDTTARKKWEEALKESDRRKDEFLAMLGHELRNPLASIHSGLSLLRKAADQESKDWVMGMLERQAGHLARMIEDLLDVSRITRGKITLRSEIVSFQELISHSLRTVRPLIEEKGLQLQKDLPDEVVLIRGDSTRLEQIATNLLENAAKYTDAGGSIEVSLRRDDDLAVFEVSDTGVGISPELLSRIFDVFSQGETPLHRTQGGLGIGLAIVKGLVDLHYGSIEAFSAGPDQGSRFVVKLPAQRGIPVPARESNPPRNLRAPTALRVLVVDDNADMAKALVKILESEHHTVFHLADGERALELARTVHPDAVLLDIGLPGKTGLELAREFRTDEELHDVQLIAITGYGQERDVLASKQAGFDRHLVKPVNSDVLLDSLRKDPADSSRTDGADAQIP